MSKSRKILGWVLTILAVIAPTWGVIGKLSNELMRTHMTDMGLGDWLTIIAVGELIAVILFVLPKTGRIGVLLMSALMGGAITIHIAHGDSFTLQGSVLVLAWAAAFVRYPDFLKFSAE